MLQTMQGLITSRPGEGLGRALAPDGGTTSSYSTPASPATMPVHAPFTSCPPSPAVPERRDPYRDTGAIGGQFQTTLRETQKKIKSAVSYIVSLTQSGIKKDYEIQNTELGKGKYGVVRPAIKRATGEAVAVKILLKEGNDDIKFTRREIEIMSKIDHPNCIGLYSVYESQRHVYIVMERVSGGQLLERIIEKDHYSETEAAKVFVQIISALDYLHSKGVVHRDLKPENILYSSKDPNSDIKVCDFGLSRLVDVDELTSGRARLWSRCGSPDYVAPEVLNRKGYGMECDVWSAGVLLYILLCGFPPFAQKHIMAKFDFIKKGYFQFPVPYWTDISDEAKQLISAMLCVDVAARITCRQALGHQWLHDLQLDKLPKENMEMMQRELKTWNATRKLVAAIHTVAALSRMTLNMDEKMIPTPEQAEELLEQFRSDPQREQGLRESFRMLDRDGAGRIRIENLCDAVRALGHDKAKQQVVNMLNQFDLYNRGYIDFEEYCIMMAVYGERALRDCEEEEEIMQQLSPLPPAFSSGGQHSHSTDFSRKSGVSSATTVSRSSDRDALLSEATAPLLWDQAASPSFSSGSGDSDKNSWPGKNVSGKPPPSPLRIPESPKPACLGLSPMPNQQSPSWNPLSPIMKPSQRSRPWTSHVLSHQELENAFRVMDLSHTGSITAPVLKELLGRFGANVTLSEAGEMVRIGDINGDGKLDLDDLWNLMLAHLAPPSLTEDKSASATSTAATGTTNGIHNVSSPGERAVATSTSVPVRVPHKSPSVSTRERTLQTTRVATMPKHCGTTAAEEDKKASMPLLSQSAPTNVRMPLRPTSVASMSRPSPSVSTEERTDSGDGKEKTTSDERAQSGATRSASMPQSSSSVSTEQKASGNEKAAKEQEKELPVCSQRVASMPQIVPQPASAPNVSQTVSKEEKQKSPTIARPASVPQTLEDFQGPQIVDVARVMPSSPKKESAIVERAMSLPVAVDTGYGRFTV